MANSVFDDITSKIFDTIDEGIYLTDRKRRILYWNRGAERITGYSADEVVGRSCADNLLNHMDRNGRLLCEQSCPLMKVAETGEEQEAEVFLHHREGHRIPILVKAFPYPDGKGEIRGMLEVFTDSSEVRLTRRKIDRMKKELLTDPLTGQGNRRMCDRELERFFRKRDEKGFSFAAAMCDIDDFKRINDRYGHDWGDRVIRMITGTIYEALREKDVIGRWGGEEFLILLHGISDGMEVLAIMERIRRLINESFLTIEGEVVKVTLSFGATRVRDTDDKESLFKRMDGLMYRSKSGGKNRVTVE